MRRTIVALALPLMTGTASAADVEASKLVGTWKVTSFTVQWLDTNEVNQPQGEHPLGFIQYSPGGHMVVVVHNDHLPRAAGPVYTDAERANIYQGIFGAYA